MPIHPNIINAVNIIKNDFTNGSTTIARHALEAFALAVSVYNRPQDIPVLKEIARLLSSAKPGMAAPKNIIGMCLSGLEKLSPPFDFSDAKREILSFMDAATETCTSQAVRLMKTIGKSEINIITCSFSSTVIKAFKKASDNNINLKVIALESKWKAHAYGQQVVEECNRINIAASLVPDNEMEKAVSRADLCLVGADSILPDGSIVNGAPSLALASSCQDKIPFYSIAESFKKNNEYHPEPGFDLVPSHLITQLITDN